MRRRELGDEGGDNTRGEADADANNHPPDDEANEGTSDRHDRGADREDKRRHQEHWLAAECTGRWP